MHRGRRAGRWACRRAGRQAGSRTVGPGALGRWAGRHACRKVGGCTASRSSLVSAVHSLSHIPVAIPPHLCTSATPPSTSPFFPQEYPFFLPFPPFLQVHIPTHLYASKVPHYRALDPARSRQSGAVTFRSSRVAGQIFDLVDQTYAAFLRECQQHPSEWRGGDGRREGWRRGGGERGLGTGATTEAAAGTVSAGLWRVQQADW